MIKRGGRTNILILLAKCSIIVVYNKTIPLSSCLWNHLLVTIVEIKTIVIKIFAIRF
jgi:hypothetical protein